MVTRISWVSMAIGLVLGLVLVLVLSETVLSETVLVIVLAAVRREVILWVMNY